MTLIRFSLVLLFMGALAMPLSAAAVGAGELCSSGSCDPGTECATSQNPPICVYTQSSVQTITTNQYISTCGKANLLPGTNFIPIVCLPFLVKYDTIGGLLNGAFGLAITFGAIAAVAMLVMGGFEYMTQDAIGAQKKARERIQGAVFGLVLLLISYLILHVINPDILRSVDLFETRLQNTSAGAPTLGPGQLQMPTPNNTPGQPSYTSPQSKIRCETQDCAVERIKCEEGRSGAVLNIASDAGVYWLICSE